MMESSLRRVHRMLAVAVALLAAGPATAQMTPLLDLRQLHSRAELLGEVDELDFQPTTPFMSINDVLHASVDGPEAGNASADAYQNSLFLPSGIFASGTTAGQFQVYTGSYEALSLSTMTFRVDGCVTYFLDATVEPGDPQSQGEITLGVPIGAPDLIQVGSGHVILGGRLSPGEYFLEGRSSITTVGPSMAGPTYGIIWTCQPCASPFIQLQPQNVAISAGGNATFQVVPNPGPTGTSQAASFTYQWRKNRAPLVDGGHIGGATTTTLSINSVSSADTGWYDVVVSNGSEEEPSAYAHLTLTTSTGVEPAGPPSSGSFSLAAASPNPSSGSTTFRFAAPRPVHASAAVYDAAGRLVRPLASRWLSGAGVLTWDGRATSGDAAPAGIYFLRVQVDGQSFVRRFVRVR